MTKLSSPLEGSAAELAAAVTPDNPYQSSGRKPRLLIVGAGMMGREHIRVSQLLGWADVQGIVDPDGGSLEWACTDWRLLTDAPLTIYRDLSEACLDEAVDATVIATPNHTHRCPARRCRIPQTPCCWRNRWPRPWLTPWTS